VTIKNSAENIEKFAAYAETYGYNKAMAELKHRLQAMAKREQNI
jgi:hypothetical protein